MCITKENERHAYLSGECSLEIRLISTKLVLYSKQNVDKNVGKS